MVEDDKNGLKLRLEKKSAETCKQSKLPPRMQQHEEQKSNINKKESSLSKEHTFKPKITGSVPKFNVL
jgi:hypothetical protein